jgi:hypothetical protein
MNKGKKYLFIYLFILFFYSYDVIGDTLHVF